VPQQEACGGSTSLTAARAASVRTWADAQPRANPHVSLFTPSNPSQPGPIPSSHARLCTPPLTSCYARRSGCCTAPMQRSCAQRPNGRLLQRRSDVLQCRACVALGLSAPASPLAESTGHTSHASIFESRAQAKPAACTPDTAASGMTMSARATTATRCLGRTAFTLRRLCLCRALVLHSALDISACATVADTHLVNCSAGHTAADLPKCAAGGRIGRRAAMATHSPGAHSWRCTPAGRGASRGAAGGADGGALPGCRPRPCDRPGARQAWARAGRSAGCAGPACRSPACGRPEPARHAPAV